MANGNATKASDSANIGSDTPDISSGTKAVPPPPPPPPPRDDVDDALDQIEGATNTGGVWGRPKKK